MSTSDQYRARAETCRQLALAGPASAKASLLMAAENWDLLAEHWDEILHVRQQQKRQED
jgi:hypothetical protein